MEMNLATMTDMNTITQLDSFVASSNGNTESCKPCESRFASIINKEMKGASAETGTDDSAGNASESELDGGPSTSENSSDLNIKLLNVSNNGSAISENEIFLNVLDDKQLKTEQSVLNMLGAAVTYNASDENLMEEFELPYEKGEDLLQSISGQARKTPAENSLLMRLIDRIDDQKVKEEILNLLENYRDQHINSKNGLIAALIDHLDGPDAATEVPKELNVQTDQEEGMTAENGLETGALLYALMNSAVNSANDLNADAEQVNSDPITDGTAVAAIKKGHPERGLKAGIFLKDQDQDIKLNHDTRSNHGTKVNKGVSKGKEDILETLTREAAKNISSDSGKATVAEKLIEHFDKIDKNARVHLRSNDIQPDIRKSDLAENNSNPKNVQNVLLSEPAKKIDKAEGAGYSPDNSAKTVKVESASANSNFPAHASIRLESGKPADTLYAVNTARPTEFTQALDKIVYVIKGSNKLGVSVDHETLGRLNINLNMEKGVLNVHINASEKVTREFIENNIQYIVDSLAKDGVSVGGFSVGLRNRSEHEGNEFKMQDEKGSREIQVVHEKTRTGAVNGLVSVFA